MYQILGISNIFELQCVGICDALELLLFFFIGVSDIWRISDLFEFMPYQNSVVLEFLIS